MQRAIRTSFVLLVMLVASVSSQAAWLYHGEIIMPTTTLDCRWPLCLGADDSRDIIYIGMFNDSGADLARNVVRLTLSDSLNGTFESIHTRTSAQGRGFCGLAYDETGDALYVTGDSSSTVSYIDKISAPHTGATPTVAQWATPTFRSVGCDLTLDTGNSKLYLMVSGLVGGTVNAYDTTNATVDSTAAALSTNYARDLVMDPLNYNIYCNRNGNLQAITGGSPSNMAGYSAGTDIVAGVNPTTMDFASGCYIGFVDLLSPSQVVWNNADLAVRGGDNISVTYLDGTPAKDETLQPDGSAIRTTWNFATDSVAIVVGGIPYLYVCDLSGDAPRLVVFVDSSSIEQWQQY